LKTEVLAKAMPMSVLATASFYDGNLMYSEPVGTNFIQPKYLK